MRSSASRQGPLASDLLNDSKTLLLMKAGYAERGFAWSPAALSLLKELGVSQLSLRLSGIHMGSSLEHFWGVSSCGSAWI